MSGPAHAWRSSTVEGSCRNPRGTTWARPHTALEAASYTEEGGLAALASLLALDPRPTAVVAGNDMIALGVLHGLRERGLSCPGDLSVIGFNDMKFVDKLTPALTTVHLPHHRLGVEAAQLLLDQLGAADRAPKVVSLPVYLVVRESTDPAAVRATGSQSVHS